jgi:undecaprenyl pyrophosphate phosphatase UppP
VSPTDPARRPGAPAGPPRWLLLMLAAGLSLLVATVLVLLLGIAGVERINEALFVVVLVVAALVGGGLVRLLAPRLPAIRRPPRS